MGRKCEPHAVFKIFRIRVFGHRRDVTRRTQLQSAIGFAIVAIALGFAFRIEPYEWLAIVICIGAVLGGECVNTAIEAVVDLASPEYHELAKRAKDCAAGGVLVCAIAAAVVEAIIILPKFFALLT